MLAIYEELFLLALDEENGNFLQFSRKSIPFGLSGAILAELAILGKVCSNEKQRLIVQDANPTGNEILDEVLFEVQFSDKPRKTSYWITHFSQKPKKLRSRLGESLTVKNLLEEDENRFYWRFQPTEGQDTPPPSKFERKIPLRAAVFTDADTDPRSVALLVVASACGLLNLIFTEDELPAVKRLIHEKVIHAALKSPTLETIEKIEYAIAASIQDEEV